VLLLGFGDFCDWRNGLWRHNFLSRARVGIATS
jgi:hypothetical protein